VTRKGRAGDNRLAPLANLRERKKDARAITREGNEELWRSANSGGNSQMILKSIVQRTRKPPLANAEARSGNAILS